MILLGSSLRQNIIYRSHDVLAANGRPLCVLLSSCGRPMVLVRLLDCILLFRRSSGWCLLVEVLVVVLSRVVDRFVVGVVVFDDGGVVGARCMRSCVNVLCCSFCLYDHPRHPSMRCLEHLLQFFRHRPRS